MGGSADSAGVRSEPGLPMDPRAAAELDRRGLGDLVGEFRSSQVRLRGLREYDVILCMEEAHRARLAEWSPALATRTFTVPEYAVLRAAYPGAGTRELHRMRHTVEKQPDIDDPVTGTQEDFRVTADRLSSLFTDII